MRVKMEEKLKKWMIKNWNERCKHYQIGCGCCDAWKCFDFIMHPDKFDNPIKNAQAELVEKFKSVKFRDKVLRKWKKGMNCFEFYNIIIKQLEEEAEE